MIPPIPPALLCPAPETPAQETHGHEGAGPEEAHTKQSQGLRVGRQAERKTPLERGEEKPLERPPWGLPMYSSGGLLWKTERFPKACSDRMKSAGFKQIQGSFRLKEDIGSGEGAGTVGQVSQGSCACPSPGTVSGRAACGFERAGLRKDIPAQFRVGWK